MRESDKDYATGTLLMQLYHYRFRPKLIPTLATLAAIPLLVSFGNWQANKANQKQALQDTYDARTTQSAVQIPRVLLNSEEYRYRKVAVRGHFETANQILLDNRVHDEQAGYHVITPFRIENSELYVLVNRGWVPLGSDRSVLPEINTPKEIIEITGVAVLPPSKIYELKQPEVTSGWQVVWQNMDIKRYREAVSFQMQPIIIQMDEGSPAGFVRVWQRPDDRIQTHRGYAFQWYGMAVMLLIFCIVTNLKKTPTAERDSND